jgi:hypothetical protein
LNLTAVLTYLPKAIIFVLLNFEINCVELKKNKLWKQFML